MFYGFYHAAVLCKVTQCSGDTQMFYLFCSGSDIDDKKRTYSLMPTMKKSKSGTTVHPYGRCLLGVSTERLTVAGIIRENRVKGGS